MRRLIPLGLLLAVSLLFATPLGADGKAFSLNSDGRWMLAQEDSQVAALHWADGREHLAVAVRLELREGGRGLWLLPVRGRVDQVRIDLLDSFPGLRGSDPRHQARQRLDGTAQFLSASQLWTLPFGMVLAGNLLESHLGAAGPLAIGDSVSRFGLRSQVVELGPAAPLTGVLAGLGAPVAGADLASLLPYTDGQHSLVATWIEDADQAQTTRKQSEGLRWPTVTVAFPSAQPWFPLRASQGQMPAGASIPLHLTVLGHHRCQPPSTLRTVHLSGRLRDDPFWGGQEGQAADFTRITGNLTDADMAADLILERFHPPGMTAAKGILIIPGWAWGLLALATHTSLSAAAGAIAGRDRQAARAGALHGLLNLATVLCVHFASRDHPQLGVRRSVSFTFGFSLTYLALVISVWLGLRLLVSGG